ncbi:MAG TPA: cysteine synthase A [Bacillota bacterium]|nr:cysteine synthase A [Bacillota bacterium]
MIYDSVSQTIGKTPLVRIKNIEKALSLEAAVAVKLESMNPCGSVKDRAALAMIEDAKARGVLEPGGVIIEPTSGNTGIGLAAIGTSMGYRVIIVMPDSMSAERVKMISLYGAQIVLTPGMGGMKAAIEKAQEISDSLGGAFIAGQFYNPANPKAHYDTTAPEIYTDTDGKLDCFVAGIGSGGTISGCGRFLKEKNKVIQVVGVEPADSPFLSKNLSGAHKIQGIGAGFKPDNFDPSVVDSIMTASTEDAYGMCRMLATHEGIFAGISSGAALSCAIKLAKEKTYKNKLIVVLLPDSGDRYLSSDVYR